MPEKSREIILTRIKNNKTRDEDKTFSPGFNFLNIPQQPLIKTFEEKLIFVNGQFFSCENVTDFSLKFKQFIEDKGYREIYFSELNVRNTVPASIETTKELTDRTEAAVTGCEYLVAQTGSAIVSTTQTKSRRSFAYPPAHIIIAFKNQLVPQLEDGLTKLAEKYKNNLPSQITTITGPSRTADIEKTMVLGAHGPKELIIFYIDDETKQ